jgi:NAD+ kinase
MVIAVYGKQFSEEFTPFIQQLFDKLNAIQADVYIYKPFNDFLENKIKINALKGVFSNSDSLPKTSDFFFSIGGDGTLLEAALLVNNYGIPIMGINTGRLGFLSTISIDETDTAIDMLVQEKFVLDNRTMLKMITESNAFGIQNYALNEATIYKKDSSSMITIHTYINDTFLNSYWADGIIIATPTGSTAYSLSCGGPIVVPGSGNFVITPVAPHNLNVRPIVVPDSSVVKLCVEGRSNKIMAALDSRSEILDTSTEIKISLNDFTTTLLRLKGHSYLQTIRNKLNWGLDKRN